ncbi:MAG: hypothetical protein ACI9WU_002056 [Myxococcota bacterium]|jgi:hypothetical protein
MEGGIERQRAVRVVTLAVLVALSVVALTHYQPYTFLHGDGAFYANINKSLWNDVGLDQGEYHPRSWLEQDLGWNQSIDQGWSNVSLGSDGTWLPKHSWVLPLFSTPLFATFGLNGLLIFQILMLTVLLVSAYAVASRLVPTGPAALATLMVAAQPVIAGDVYSYNNDAFYSALLLAGVWAFSVRHWSLSGLLFGLGCWAKLTNVLFVLPFALAVLWRSVTDRDWRILVRALGPFLAPLIVFAASNWLLFGSPTTTSYDTIIVRDDGVLKTESIAARFEEPFGEGLDRVFEDQHEGLDHKAPLLYLAGLGLILGLWTRKQRGWAAAFGVVLLLFLALHAKYHYTYARFFLPAAGLSVIPSAFALQAAGRFAYWRPALGAGGVGIVLWSLCAWATADDTWRATDHIQEAAVINGRKAPCDYFNNLHQKFECRADGPRGADFFWGLALGDDQCTFDDEPRRMLWLHPPKGVRKRTLTWNNVPSGRLVLEYGLAQTSRHDDVSLTIRVNGEIITLPTIDARGVIKRFEAPAGTLRREHNSLQLEVRSRPADWRHLCVEAIVSND